MPLYYSQSLKMHYIPLAGKLNDATCGLDHKRKKTDDRELTENEHGSLFLSNFVEKYDMH